MTHKKYPPHHTKKTRWRFHLCPRTDLNAARRAHSNAVPNFFIAQIFAEMLLLGSGDPAGSPASTVFFVLAKWWWWWYQWHDKQRKGNHQPTATPHKMSSMMLSSFSSLHSKRHDGVFLSCRSSKQSATTMTTMYQPTNQPTNQLTTDKERSRRDYLNVGAYRDRGRGSNRDDLIERGRVVSRLII